MDRRSFLMAGGLGLAACGRRRAVGFAGYAFVANEEGEAIAAVDLTAFAVARHIRLGAKPTEIVADPLRTAVYALAPASGTVYEISTADLGLKRKQRVADAAVSMQLDRDGGALWVLGREPKQLIRLPTDTFRPDARIPFAAAPVALDLAPEGVDPVAAVSFGTAGMICQVDLRRRRAHQPISVSPAVGALRYRSDGRSLLVADTAQRRLAIYETASEALVTELPLAVRPDQLCFGGGGGQLFITGEGMDAVVIVYPHHIPQVGGTLLAGRTPGAMATSKSPAFLFLSNSTSNVVTIVDIASQKVLAVVEVGSAPGFITVTPDDAYALVLNQQSGDMAVIRIASLDVITASMRRMKSAPLFMMVPVGSKPVFAAVRRV